MTTPPTTSTPAQLRVLVLDAQYCHALAAVRSLGRSGAVVTTASHKQRAMGFASRYVANRLACPSPIVEREPYAEWLLETLRRGRYDATLFFEEATADILSLHRAAVQKLTGCPMPAREIFLAASRKDRIARLASQIGVAVPQTHELERLADAESLAGKLEFPVIVKGVHSSGSQQVELVRKSGQLVETVERVAALRHDPAMPLPIVQEYIEGHGYGLTALVRRGQPVTVFMHRRLGEHDIAQGVGLAHGATGAQSVDEPELRAAGTAILEALCWDGIAMVEFKRRRSDGRFFLIELNPRFVGSLELAIAAGVDLPWLYAQMAARRPIVGPNRYRVGLRYRWLLSKNVAVAFENPLGYAFGALSALFPGTRTDLSWRDPRPHWTQIRNAGWWTREYLRKRIFGRDPAPMEAPSAPPRSRPAPLPRGAAPSGTVSEPVEAHR
jgi:predicted ATP-grasp superfamily ATP-dependent carboligase